MTALNINLLKERGRHVAEKTKEFDLEKEFRGVIHEWFKNTQVYLASSSEVRKQGLISEGFEPDNIHLVPMPDQLEVDAFEDYLNHFSPSWVDPNGSVMMEHVAKKKADFLKGQGVPDEALWFAFDTLPICYQANSEFGTDVTQGPWRARAEKKPESLEERKASIKMTFLTLMRNHIRFNEFLRRAGRSWEEIEKDDDMNDAYQRRDFASGVHVKTAFAVKFPYEDTITVYSDRIIVRPNRLYTIADELQLLESSDDIREFTPESLLDVVHPSSGKKVGVILDEIIKEITSEMELASINPLTISGGIAYHLDSVKRILDVTETPNIMNETGDKADQSIYTGFPKELFRKIVAAKALQIAESKRKS